MASKKKSILTEPQGLDQPAAKVAKPTQRNSEFIGRLRGVFEVVGDIESPVDPPEAWEYD